MKEEIEEFLEEICPFLPANSISSEGASEQTTMYQDVITRALLEAVQWAKNLKSDGKLYKVRNGMYLSMYVVTFLFYKMTTRRFVVL
jgi:hypothetical protein